MYRKQMSFLDKTLVGGNLAFAFHLQLQQVQLQQVRTTCVKGLMSAEQHGGRDLGSSVCLLFFWRDIYTATFFSSFFFFSSRTFENPAKQILVSHANQNLLNE